MATIVRLALLVFVWLAVAASSVFGQGPLKPGLFPRRALAISVNDYLLMDTLSPGQARLARFPGSSATAVLRDLGNFHLNFPNTQLFELTDATELPGRVQSIAPFLPTIKTAVADFLKTSRAQDRVVLLFAGHAVEDDQAAYLVPLEGHPKKPATLLPLQWVYEQLRLCRARQKVLILDVCRCNPARSPLRPWSGPMGPVLDSMVRKPPPGVQVWAACRQGQFSYEKESGGLFFQALCAAMQERLPGFPEPENSLPLEVLRERVDRHLQALLAPRGRVQNPRFVGGEAREGARYDPEEPLAPQLSLSPVPSGAAKGELQLILDEIHSVSVHPREWPYASGRLLVHCLPPFPAASVDQYRADYRDLSKFRDRSKEFPLRAAVVKARDVLLHETNRFHLHTDWGGDSFARNRPRLLKLKAEVTRALTVLQEAQKELAVASQGRDKESSRRWQVNLDITLARLRARVVFLAEYQHALDELAALRVPPLPEGIRSYFLNPATKLQTPDPAIRQLAAELTQDWQKIVERNPGTPWAMVAQREGVTFPGLQWRPAPE